ncbi:MAG: DinB family protein, partial [Gemmatirosa sp.]
RAVRDELTVARGALLAAVEAFPPARLNDRVGTSDDAAIGGQATFAGMLVGLAEHNAYHGGQITVLRRALQ